mmetsp:Transcript_20269/g.30054  ORF Transcript_20269/g.30054 Transcript_20269/m.30054 type:complete len:237 (-) Transcript_20269:744-1454(-)
MKSIAAATRAFIRGRMLAMIGCRNESSTPSPLKLLLLVPPSLSLSPAPYLANILSTKLPPSGVPITPANAAVIPNHVAATFSSSNSCSARMNAPPNVPRAVTTPKMAACPNERVTRILELRHVLTSDNIVNLSFFSAALFWWCCLDVASAALLLLLSRGGNNGSNVVVVVVAVNDVLLSRSSSSSTSSLSPSIIAVTLPSPSNSTSATSPLNTPPLVTSLTNANTTNNGNDPIHIQ